MESPNEATLIHGTTYVHGRETAILGNATLKAKIAELIATKEELKKAKDTAMQSWLDSRPLLDQLENAKAELAVVKTRSSKSSTVVEELQSQLEGTISVSKLKREAELVTTKTTNELTRAIDETSQEMDGVKVDIGELRRSRSKLKQDLRLRRQMIRALQLAVRAARIEAEAVAASTEDARRQISGAEMEGSPLEMTQEEYSLMRRKAQEETSLAEWRVAASEEQRVAAEEGRNAAVARFEGGVYVRRTSMIEEEMDRKEAVGQRVVDDGDGDRRIEEEGTRRRRVHEKADVIRPRDRGGAFREFEYRRGYTNGGVNRRTGDGRRRKKKANVLFGRIRSFLRKTMAKLFGY